jgi:hypothetical protein
MGHNPGTGSAAKLGHAADVVGMPVRQQDGVHIADSTSGRHNRSHHLVGPPRQPGVNQHYAVIHNNGVGVDVSDGDLNDPIDYFAHSVNLSYVGRVPATPKWWTSQTADRAPNSSRTSGATLVPKSSMERMISA